MLFWRSIYYEHRPFFFGGGKAKTPQLQFSRVTAESLAVTSIATNEDAAIAELKKHRASFTRVCWAKVMLVDDR